MCDIDDAVAFSTGAYAIGFREALLDWKASGYLVRDAESFSYRVEQVSVTPQEAVARATWCVNDLSVVFQREAGDGTDTIIDSSSPSYRVVLQVDKIDGAWLVSASEVIERSESKEEDLCA